MSYPPIRPPKPYFNIYNEVWYTQNSIPAKHDIVCVLEPSNANPHEYRYLLRGIGPAIGERNLIMQQPTKEEEFDLIRKFYGEAENRTE